MKYLMIFFSFYLVQATPVYSQSLTPVESLWQFLSLFWLFPIVIGGAFIFQYLLIKNMQLNTKNRQKEKYDAL